MAIAASNLSGQNVALSDPSAVSLSGQTPNFSVASGFNNGVMFSFNPLTNNNVETPTGYTIQWSTSSNTNSDGSLTSPAGQTTFPASGSDGANLWILNNANPNISGLSSGQTYYFVVQASAGSSTSNYSSVAGPATLQDSNTGNLVSGAVSWTGTASGPLYVGFYNTNTGQAYATQVGSSAAPPISPATYSIQVPDGGSYYFFAVVDNNNDGLVDPGDFQDVNGNSGPGVVSIPMSGSPVSRPDAARRQCDRQCPDGI